MDEQARPFFIGSTVEQSRVTVRVAGECDAASLPEVEEALRKAASDRPAEVVVDLSDTTFIDSMTLGTLTAAAKRVRVDGGVFRVVGAVAPAVARAFEVTGLRRFLIETA